MFLVVLIFTATFVFGRTIKDMTGRSVDVPDNMDRIIAYDSKTSLFIFPLLQNKMVAVSKMPGLKKCKYISEEFNNLPQIDIKQLENVLVLKPQVIIAGIFDEDKNQLQRIIDFGNKINVPVIFIKLSLTEADKSYSFLGRVFQQEKESNVLCSYLNNVYQTIDSLKQASSKPIARVYYSLGPNGLMTDPPGSKHTEVLDFLNIENVADVSIPVKGRVEVSLEQVIDWNPDYIFTSSFKGKQSGYQDMIEDGNWKTISAVKKNKVYKVPSDPFGWFDYPPSINRIPGIIWLATIFYHLPAFTEKEDIIEFYKLFYHYSLSSKEYLELMNN